jgi:hypothetical protein
MPEVEEVEDVTEHFEKAYGNCLMAERRGANVLVLYKLSDKFQRFDGKWASYQLTYRWLPHQTAELNRVQGEERTYYLKKEVDLKKGLFEQFNLF